MVFTIELKLPQEMIWGWKAAEGRRSPGRWWANLRHPDHAKRRGEAQGAPFMVAAR